MSYVAIYSREDEIGYLAIRADDEIAAKQKALRELARLTKDDNIDRKLLDVAVAKSSAHVTYLDWLAQSSAGQAWLDQS